MEDAVDVIWHNDKRIERQVSKTCRQLLPRFYKYVTEFRPIEKWLALIKEVIPAVAKVAVLRNATSRTHDVFWKEAQRAAQGR